VAAAAPIVDDDDDYEKQRLQNVMRNEEILRSLNLEPMAPVVTSVARKAKTSPVQKKRTRPVDEEAPAPRRKSARIAGKSVSDEANTQTTYYSEPERADGFAAEHIKEEKLSVDQSSDWNTMFSHMQDSAAMSEATPPPPPADLVDTVNALKGLILTDVYKVVGGRVCSACFHPRPQPLVAVGDKYGSIGFISLPDVGDESEPTIVTFSPHAMPVTAMAFDKTNDNHLFSCAQDGTVRTLDTQKQAFTLTYTCQEPHTKYQNMCAAAEATGNNVKHLARDDGSVDTVDMRVDTKVVQSFAAHQAKVNSVSAFENSIATASLDRSVCVFDIRKVHTGKKVKATYTFTHGRSVNDAVFDPVTGSLQSTCQDHLLRVWSPEDLAKAGEPQPRKIRHNTHTGRWLTKLQAKWMPSGHWGNTQPIFVIGSMERPRRITYISANSGSILTNAFDDELASVQSVNVFHPSQKIVCGANSSGRIHIFR